MSSKIKLRKFPESLSKMKKKKKKKKPEGKFSDK